MRVRTAALDDAEAIAAIYNVEVLETTATFDLEPRTLDAQRRWLLERSGAHVVLVAESDDGEVIAFASLSPYKERPAYSTTVESSVYVLSLWCVHLKSLPRCVPNDIDVLKI